MTSQIRIRNFKSSLLIFAFSIVQVACSCSKTTADVVDSSEKTNTPPTTLTLRLPAKTADNSNLWNFALEGECPPQQTIQISTGAITKTLTCPANGNWKTTLNVATFADGAYVITALTLQSQAAPLTADFTKSTAPACEGGPTVFSNNMNARYVIGQADMTSNLANRGGAAGANTLNNPIGIVVNNGQLYVADAGNNRVLVYNTLPTSNGVSADAVIGQSDFSSTAGGTSATSLLGVQQIAVDGNYLAVAEWSNARVSFWPLQDPKAATVIWGQPDANSKLVNNGGLSDKSMGSAAGLSYADGKFLVGDVTNNRILIFDSENLSTFQSAINVIGQPDFTTGSKGSGLTGFGSPYSVSTDGQHVAIMDNSQERILIHNQVPSTNGAAASLAWGGSGVTSTNLRNPVGVFIGDEKLFIADRQSDRVLVFNSIPTAASQPADFVLGQTNFTGGDHNQCNCTSAKANTLWGVHHVYWDGCRLYVTDKQNNRVLVY